MSATLEKALILIEAMAGAGRPCGVTQLSRDLDLNKSTVYRLLDILCRHGFVRQEESSRQYMLTTRMWELGVQVLQELSVHSVARPFMTDGARDTGETLLLAILEGEQGLVIDKVKSSRTLQIFSPIGSRVVLHCSSVGKALILDWTDEQLHRYAPQNRPRLTEHSPNSVEALAEQLRQARELGYALAVDEFEIGVTGVAAPIRDAEGAIVGSLGITGPTSRLDADRISELGVTAVETAARISRVLGHVPAEVVGA